ncbi:hypothetical protein ACYOEI_17830 [Singulisphaera rosea]
MKLRYQTILDALNRVAGDLSLLAITLTDIPESEGHTLMRIDLPDRFARLENELLDVLRYEIFELDDLYQFGLVRFRLTFRAGEAFEGRKVRRVTDRRLYLGDEAPEVAEESSTGPTSDAP